MAEMAGFTSYNCAVLLREMSSAGLHVVVNLVVRARVDWKRRAESKRNAGHYMLKRPTHSSQGGLSGQSGQRLLRVAHSGKAFLYGRDGRVHQLQLCGATSRNEFSWIARSGKSRFNVFRVLGLSGTIHAREIAKSSTKLGCAFRSLQ